MVALGGRLILRTLASPRLGGGCGGVRASHVRRRAPCLTSSPRSASAGAVLRLVLKLVLPRPPRPPTASSARSPGCTSSARGGSPCGRTRGSQHARRDTGRGGVCRDKHGDEKRAIAPHVRSMLRRSAKVGMPGNGRHHKDPLRPRAT